MNMKNNNMIVMLLGLVIAGAGFGCEYEISGAIRPIEPCVGEDCPCVGADCPCVGEDCPEPELCRNNQLDEQEACDIVDGVTRYQSNLSCTSLGEDYVGTLNCTSLCQVDYSGCEQEESCQAETMQCAVETVGGKDQNVVKSCVDGEWQTTTCEGSCIEGECIPCQSWDPVCYVAPCSGPNELSCAGTCCDKTKEFCDLNGVGSCCSFENVCGQHCCPQGSVCENAVCRKQCEHERCVDAQGAELCCANAGEICISNQCFMPTVTCVDNYTCEAGQYCEPLTQQCLPQPKTEPACVRKPTGGEVKPTELWFWGEGKIEADAAPTHFRVMMTPVAADLDKDGVPEVVINTYSGSYVEDGILRILNGLDGTLKHSVLDPNMRTVGGGQIALGDLDGDKIPEIVTCSSPAHELIAFKADGSLYWRTNIGKEFCSQTGMGIADFDGDGKAEVYVRYLVFAGQPDAGTQIAPLKWGDEARSQFGVGMGGHAMSDYTIAADLDADGRPELVGGNVAYKFSFDSTGKMTAQKLYDRAPEHPDGYPSVGDLNLDGVPEIVVVRDGTLMAFKNDGSNYWTAPVDNNGAYCPSGNCKGGGTATIANVNTSPEPEITLATALTYAVFNADGTIWWQKHTKDRSSQRTGSSVFDFDGDGIAEIVYNDEWFLRIYNGQERDEDKGVVFCQCNPSATHWEYPIVVDVNNDGAAEIVVGSTSGACPNDTQLTQELGRDNCTSTIVTTPAQSVKVGLRVFAAPNKDWVGTRKIWNQHAYSITNVSDDGSIPKNARANWKVPGLNNFRLNVDPGARNLPDLVVESISSSTFHCDKTVQLYFDVHNRGWAAAPKDVPISIYVLGEGGTKTLAGTVSTSAPILPGQHEPIGYTYTRPDGNDLNITLQFSVEVGNASFLIECQTGNNGGAYAYTCTPKAN